MDNHFVIMVRHDIECVVFAPLYIHSFLLLQPHFSLDAEKFNITYSDPAQMDNVGDKLRWYRYKKALRQLDVAEYAGLDRSTYNSYETNDRDFYPVETMNIIALLLEVPITELFDEYNTFLYVGQGQQLKCLRNQLGITQREYAD